MTKNFNDANVTLTTSETDIYVSTSKTMTLLIQAVNTSSSDVTVELWITNGSNTHEKAILRSKVITPEEGGVSDTTKHIIRSGYKIRGTASIGSSVTVEVSVLEGM